MELVTIDDSKPIKKLIKLDEVEAIKSHIVEGLSRPEYNFVITLDNIKDAKQSATDLNKSISYLKKFASEKIDSESADIESFKSAFKEFQSLIDDKRNAILSDVSVFENIKKGEHKEVIEATLSMLYNDAGVRNEFRFPSSSVSLSINGLTSKGSLNKKSLDEVVALVDKAKGDQAIYDLKQKEIEIEREKEVQRRLQEERERQSLLKAQSEAFSASRVIPSEPLKEPVSEVVNHYFGSSLSGIGSIEPPCDIPTLPAQNGYDAYIVSVQLRVEVPSNTQSVDIASAIIPMLIDVGFDESEIKVIGVNRAN